MKLFILVLSLSLAQSALALHNYSSETCQAKTPNGKVLQVTRPDGISGFFTIHNEEKVGVYENMPDEEKHRTRPSGSDLVLISGQKTIQNVKDYDDGCFEGTTSQFVRRARVKSISEELSKKYDLKAKATLDMTCVDEALTPAGKDCFDTGGSEED